MDTVFFVDVDNTLLNNDKIKIEIKESLKRVLGDDEAEHFWRHHDSFRAKTDLVDFPAIIRQYCSHKNANTCDANISKIFSGIDFARSLYPNAFSVLKHLRSIGAVYIFTEGDMVYQKQKVEKSGLSKKADGVLLYKHKLDHLRELIKRFADKTLVFIDDKNEKLTQIKEQIPKSITVVVCQGHYASEKCTTDRQADLVYSSIDELKQFSLAVLTSIQAPRRFLPDQNPKQKLQCRRL